MLPLAIVLTVGALTQRSLWVGRYLIIALPPLWLLAAESVWSTPRTLRVAAVTTLTTWALLAGPLAERARERKPSWSLVVRALAGGSPATVCVNEPFLGLTLQYHALLEQLPLRVLDFPACATQHADGTAILRPETAASLATLAREGAVVGPARALWTALPDTELHTLRWSTR